LNDIDIIHVTQSPTTQKAAIDLVSPAKESVARMQSSTKFPIDLSTPEKKAMAVTLKLTTQKSIKAPLSDVLRNDTEDASHTALQKELNVEPIEDVTLDHGLEDKPSNDDKDMARVDVEQPDGEMMEMNDLDNTPMKDANNDEPIVDGMELVAYGTLNDKKYTLSQINNPTQLNPVKVNVKATPIKHKGGDLLKQLHLDDILLKTTKRCEHQ
jgi:hypothetical protein